MIINEEAEVDIPAETINKANHVGPKKKKNQSIIVRFSTFRYRTSFLQDQKETQKCYKVAHCSDKEEI